MKYMHYYFVTGNYCRSDEQCLEVYRLDPQIPCLQKISDHTGLTNPSFVLYDGDRRLLYAVEELNPEGRICALKDDGFSFRKAVSFLTRGADPCHLSLDGQKEFLFAANYSGGSLAVFRLDEAGVPVMRTDLVQHTGSGPKKDRQEMAHVHFSHWFEEHLYVCDLGIDRIFCYSLDRRAGKLAEEKEFSIQMPPGTGPRHLAFPEDTPDILYCVGELNNTVHVLKKSEDRFRPVQVLSTLPEGFIGETKASAVKCTSDGKYLLVSNRGYDSIAVFRRKEDGMLDADPVISPTIEFPRDFAVFDRYVIVGSETQSEIRIYELNEGGSLTDTGRSYASLHPVLIETLE